MKWMADQKTSLVNRGAPVGKKKRIDTKGIRNAKNDVCGYSIVQGNPADEATKVFEGPAVFADARRVDRNHRDPGDPGGVGRSCDLQA
jgi:hypothetical protein